MTDAAGRLTTALSGRYRIERELGQGGMATVYLAQDLRHARRVALKVLRPELAAVIGAERFLHEITTTANLQHPHILPLHDSGEAGGMVFYVMPYVEGESLRDRLSRDKQLPVDEAVRITREVAEALDYAHRHGVVHRDIKPENILLHDGHVQVADFGIALAVSTAGGGTRMTETGMSLGTPHYMSPEQAMGEREITARSDVYALGCVLYEMLTGEPPFNGPTAQAIVARVLTESPRPLLAQRHTIPPHVEAAALTALEKLPADRFASAAEFAAALANPRYTSATSVGPGGGVAAARRDWRSHLAIPMTAVAALAAAAALWALTRPGPAKPVTRYALAFPASQAPRADRIIRISPDGSRLIFVGPGVGATQLWVKPRDRAEATPLAGTANVLNFTISPDGESVAFVQGGQLKKLPLVGGAATTLADSVSAAPGLAWLDDGTLVYIQAGARELRQIPDVGGPERVVWRSDSITVFNPTPLPGGRGVLFSACRGQACAAGQELWVLDLRSSTVRRLQTGVIMGQYLPTGHVMYVRRDGGMFALPFDAGSLQAQGSPVPVLDSISVLNFNAPIATVSAEGTLVIRPGAALTSQVRYDMVWVDRTGRDTPIDSTWTFQLTNFGLNSGWALSPDGTRLAIGLATDAGDDIWVKQLPRGPLSRLSFDSTSEFRPRWTPDGQSVMFISNRSASTDIYRRRADGTGGDSLVLDIGPTLFEGVWSADSKWLIIRTGGTIAQVGGRDIYVLRPGVDTTPVPIAASTVFDESAAMLSPDGHWIAYESNETGRTEVYLRPFPNTEGGKWQVSTSGGVAPLWSPNSRELFFVDGARQMTVTSVSPGPSPQLGERQALFHLRDELYLASPENYTPYDISPDGRRFIMARRVRSETLQAAPLVLVENWFEELKRKLGK